MSLKQLVSSANFVYLQPDSKALEYFADLGFANIAVAKGKPLSHNDRVQKMVNQLISNEVNAMFLGRVLFDYNNPAQHISSLESLHFQPLSKKATISSNVFGLNVLPLIVRFKYPLKSTCSSSILLHRMFHFMVGMNATLIPYITAPNNSSRMG